MRRHKRWRDESGPIAVSYRARRPRQQVNRSAHLLMPPFRCTKAASDSACGLYSIAYRSTRDHLDRVCLSTFSGFDVHKMMAANGSSFGKSKRHNRSAIAS
jgi:hypothetical protein